MKKALIVTATAGFIKGFLLHDIELLQEKGYEVHCASNGNLVKTFNVNEFFKRKGVIFHQIDFSSTSPLSNQTIVAAKQFKKLINQYDYGVIHCHTPIVGAIVRFMANSKRKRGCKVMYTTHGLAFPKGSSLKSKIIYGTAEYICSHFCDAIVTINKEDYKTMKKMLCKNVYYINGVGVDTQKYIDVKINRKEYRKELGIQNDDVMVLQIGELSERKNHQVIIKALSILNDPKYVFVICGKVMTNSGTYDKLLELSKKLNVRTIFLGFRSDIPEICHCADITVLPSIREGLGLAGVESLASGVPVIGSNIQGIKDYVVNDYTGYLCDSNSEKQFADGILKLSNKKIRKAMKENCIEKSKEFDISICYLQMKKIYEEVLGE